MKTVLADPFLKNIQKSQMKMLGKENERGTVLVLVTLISLALATLGTTALWVGASGTNITANTTRRQEAMNAAEAGFQRAKQVLNSSLDWDLELAGCGAAGNDPARKGNVMCIGNQPIWYWRVVEPGTASETLTSGMDAVTYRVFVRNDDAEYASCVAPINCADDNDGRIIVRVEGFGKSGAGFVAIEATVTRGGAGGLLETNYSQEGQSAAGGNTGTINLAVP